MFFKGADQGPVARPYFKPRDSREVVVALWYGVHDCQAFQLHHAVSGLCRGQRRAAALNKSKLVLVDLDEGKSDAVEARGVRQDHRFDFRVEWL